jgi:hypothetical protein
MKSEVQKLMVPIALRASGLPGKKVDGHYGEIIAGGGLFYAWLLHQTDFGPIVGSILGDHAPMKIVTLTLFFTTCMIGYVLSQIKQHVYHEHPTPIYRKSSTILLP